LLLGLLHLLLKKDLLLRNGSWPVSLRRLLQGGSLLVWPTPGSGRARLLVRTWLLLLRPALPRFRGGSLSCGRLLCGRRQTKSSCELRHGGSQRCHVLRRVAHAHRVLHGCQVSMHRGKSVGGRMPCSATAHAVGRHLEAILGEHVALSRDEVARNKQEGQKKGRCHGTRTGPATPPSKA
jgi:hypothetical protein